MFSNRSNPAMGILVCPLPLSFPLFRSCTCLHTSFTLLLIKAYSSILIPLASFTADELKYSTVHHQLSGHNLFFPQQVNFFFRWISSLVYLFFVRSSWPSISTISLFALFRFVDSHLWCILTSSSELKLRIVIVELLQPSVKLGLPGGQTSICVR